MCLYGGVSACVSIRMEYVCSILSYENNPKPQPIGLMLCLQVHIMKQTESCLFVRLPCQKGGKSCKNTKEVDKYLESTKYQGVADRRRNTVCVLAACQGGWKTFPNCDVVLGAGNILMQLCLNVNRRMIEGCSHIRREERFVKIFN